MLSFYVSMVETEEEKSFISELYEKYEQVMYHTALGILHNKYDAEDAVQEAFIRIIKNLGKFSHIDADKLGYYIVIIVKNICFDMLRKKNHTPKQSIDEMYDLQDDKSVLDEVISEITYGKIIECLLQLNETDYEILYLRVFMEHSYKEIAELINIKEGAVKQRLYVARKHLMKIIEKEELL